MVDKKISELPLSTTLSEQVDRVPAVVAGANVALERVELRDLLKAYMGEWDVTSTSTAPGVLSSFNTTYVDGVMTPTFVHGTSMVTAGVIFDSSVVWEESNVRVGAALSGQLASMVEGEFGPELEWGYYAGVGFTSNPATLETDLMDLLTSNTPFGARSIALYLNTIGQYTIGVYTTDYGVTSDGFEGLSVVHTDGDVLSIHTGSDSLNKGSLLGLYDNGSLKDFSTFESLINVPVGEVMYPFLAVLRVPGVFPPTGYPSLSVVWGAGSANPQVAGTTAEGNSVTQEQVDAIHAALYAELASAAPITELPETARVGYTYKAVHGSPGTLDVLGIPVASGDILFVTNTDTPTIINLSDEGITEAAVNALIEDVTTPMQAEIDQLQDDVDQLQTDVGNLQTDVGNLQTEVNGFGSMAVQIAGVGPTEYRDNATQDVATGAAIQTLKNTGARNVLAITSGSSYIATVGTEHIAYTGAGLLSTFSLPLAAATNDKVWLTNLDSTIAFIGIDVEGGGSNILYGNGLFSSYLVGSGIRHACFTKMATGHWVMTERENF